MSSKLRYKTNQGLLLLFFLVSIQSMPKGPSIHLWRHIKVQWLLQLLLQQPLALLLLSLQHLDRVPERLEQQLELVVSLLQ
jgi:hypothetical protein